ncbi:hypothetical protein AMK26_13920 [Streptomyces sp. CB03234]|uniref:hypothetical protein n=1 Tax=Streptomyces sp. (strain CB03234) TaxID=1703937 RepID=UPI00093A0973|nr:hypothetical protein [Streptomyces sp. CB03234]OKK04450.1 hypothetical protein AMK26_13920 [Streptomyces sp. CB03234]
MTVHHLPEEVEAFARHLGRLVAVLDEGGGWYGVFRQRDPDGMRACLDGAEVPPWDVVESLLQDLAAVRGGTLPESEAVRVRHLHAAAAAAHDRRPGGREALRERLALMVREQAGAVRRGEELVALLGTVPEGSPDAERLAHDLAWVRDDHARATARIEELGARLAALPETPAPAPRERSRTAAGAKPRKRPRGARYAWLEDVDEDALPDAAPEPDPVPHLPPTAAAPRGARFGGGPGQGGPGQGPGQAPGQGPGHGGPERERQQPKPQQPYENPDDAARRAAHDTVTALLRLRAEGRGGEAHVLLCEAAAWPAARLPLLAAELHRAGLAPDWATLLWEAASLPPERLVDLSGALTAAGRDQDARQLLRQGVARPTAETAAAVLALDEAGRPEEAQALVDAFVRSRTAEDAARLAAYAPYRLVPHLLSAARALAATSPSHERDLVHALRVAGLSGA